MASNIVLADAQATPVNHTFVPIGRDKNGVMIFEDQSQANAIGFWRLTVDLKRPPAPNGKTSSDGRSYRVRVELSEPVLETLSNNSAGMIPAPTVSYTPRAFSDFVLPERSSLLNRKDLRKMMASALADAQVIASVENLVYIS